jgi:hypothetical protein
MVMDLSLEIEGDSSGAQQALSDTQDALDALKGSLESVDSSALEGTQSALDAVGSSGDAAAEGLSAAANEAQFVGVGANEAGTGVNDLASSLGGLHSGLGIVTGGLTDLAGGLDAGAAGFLGMAATVVTAVGALGAFGANWATGMMKIQAVLGMSAYDAELYSNALSDVGASSDRLLTMGYMLERKLASVVLQMQNGKEVSSNLTMALAKLGVEFRDTNGEMISMGIILPDILNKLGTMADKEEAVQLATQLFGRAGSAILPLIANYSEVMETATRQTEESSLAAKDATSLAIDYNSALTGLEIKLNELGVETLPLLSLALRGVSEMFVGGKSVIGDYVGAVGWANDRLKSIGLGFGYEEDQLKERKGPQPSPMTPEERAEFEAGWAKLAKPVVVGAGFPPMWEYEWFGREKTRLEDAEAVRKYLEAVAAANAQLGGTAIDATEQLTAEQQSLLALMYSLTAAGITGEQFIQSQIECQNAAAWLTDKAIALDMSLEDLVDVWARSGLAAEEFGARIEALDALSNLQDQAKDANDAVNDLYDSFNNLFSKPTEEGILLKFDLDQLKLKRAKLVERAGGDVSEKEQEAIDKIDTQIDSIRREMDVREANIEVMKDLQVMADHTLLTDAAQEWAARNLIDQMGPLSQTAAAVNKQLFFMAISLQDTIRWFNSLASGEVSSMQHGGVAAYTGLYHLEAGEVVSRPGQSSGGTIINNFGRISNVFPKSDPRTALKETDRLFRGF